MCKMKKVLLKSVLLLAFVFAGWSASAGQPSDVGESVRKMAKEFEKEKGVECMVVEKGLIIGIIKASFKAKFGKEFMKDVTSMVIINYSEASNEVAETFRKRVDSYAGVLQEMKPNKENTEEGHYEKCYAKLDETSLSDMMILIEDKESRIFLYMDGKLNLEKLQL